MLFTGAALVFVGAAEVLAPEVLSALDRSLELEGLGVGFFSPVTSVVAKLLAAAVLGPVALRLLTEQPVTPMKARLARLSAVLCCGVGAVAVGSSIWAEIGASLSRTLLRSLFLQIVSTLAYLPLFVALSLLAFSKEGGPAAKTADELPAGGPGIMGSGANAPGV